MWMDADRETCRDRGGRYAKNAILGNGTLPPGMAVLTKPFAMDNMAARIRSMNEGGKEQARRA